MMNARNLASKESLGLKFQEGILAKLCLKVWFESYWYFCYINEQDGFESSGLKATGIFVILLSRMVLKAAVKKQSS